MHAILDRWRFIGAGATRLPFPFRRSFHGGICGGSVRHRQEEEREDVKRGANLRISYIKHAQLLQTKLKGRLYLDRASFPGLNRAERAEKCCKRSGNVDI